MARETEAVQRGFASAVQGLDPRAAICRKGNTQNKLNRSRASLLPARGDEGGRRRGKMIHRAVRDVRVQVDRKRLSIFERGPLA